MEPIALEQKRGETVLVQRCVTCGFVRRNRRGPADDADALIALAADLARAGPPR